jgi:hypothetical protein
VADLEEARRRFAYALGVEVPEVLDSLDDSDLTSASEWMRGVGRFVVLEIGRLQLILIQCAEGEPETSDRMHHLSFESDDLDESVKSLTDLGGALVSKGATEGDQRFALIDGRDPLSCYLELLESDRGLG